MNEELQDTLNRILTEAASTAADAKTFVLSELPEVVEQLLVWKMAESVIYSLIGIALFSLHIWGAKKYYQAYLVDIEECEKEEEFFFFGTTVVSTGLIFWIPGIIFMDLDWLQILVAPKVYLIEYAAKLAG